MKAGDKILHDRRAPETSIEARGNLRVILTMDEEKNVQGLKELSGMYEEFRKRAFEQQQAFYAINETVRESAKAAIADCRDLRMSLSSEINAMVASLKDLRSLVQGPQHDEAILRLREFTELAERLKVLKDSGFLDAVADTILKLDGVR